MIAAEAIAAAVASLIRKGVPRPTLSDICAETDSARSSVALCLSGMVASGAVLRVGPRNNGWYELPPDSPEAARAAAVRLIECRTTTPEVREVVAGLLAVQAVPMPSPLPVLTVVVDGQSVAIPMVATGSAPTGAFRGRRLARPRIMRTLLLRAADCAEAEPRQVQPLQSVESPGSLGLACGHHGAARAPPRNAWV